VTARFAATAFSGEGARRYGGRWNRKGIGLVYTAESLSLAMLEMLVQDQPPRARYTAIPADIPTGVAIEWIEPGSLPADWREPPALETLRALGGDWIARRSSAVLAVPSAVIPEETNFLLSPAHPDFAKIEIQPPRDLATDLRLIGSRARVQGSTGQPDPGP
jgi:RES domain-containing protein